MNKNNNCVHFVFKVSLIFNTEKLEVDLIGKIDCNFNNCLKKVNMYNRKTIDLIANPYGLCTLPNDNLIITYPVQNIMTLHTSDLSQIRTIESIDYRFIQPRYLATNGRNRIYISQSDHHKITITDLEFRLIKEIGAKGHGEMQFNYPLGICHFEDSIFVCDSENQRIQNFNENFLYQDTFAVDFKPLSLRIINNFACIRSNSEDFVYFYSLYPFRLINKLNIFGYSAIFSTKFWFYVFDSVTKEINSYDIIGNKVDTLAIDFEDNISSKEKISFEFSNNNNLIISCRLAKKLILFF